MAISMKITYKGDYALKTILELAGHYGRSPMTIHELAKRADIPIKFLEQILLDLKKGGFVESRRGKIGGYLLAKEPKKIKLGEVIRFIEGPIELVACVGKNYKGCANVYGCVLRDIWRQVDRATAKIIDDITFEDLLKKTDACGPALSYQI